MRSYHDKLQQIKSHRSGSHVNSYKFEYFVDSRIFHVFFLNIFKEAYLKK